MLRNAIKAGFTLVELLVVLILLGLLTAIVFPVVVQQIDDAEPTKIANDLANIKTGVDVFHLNVRPRWPGDLEDLVHQVDNANDADITNTAFGTTHEVKWKGPYIDAAIPLGTVAGTALKETTNAVVTGFGLNINNELVCYDAGGNVDAGATCTSGTHFVAAQILGATINVGAAVGSEGSEFASIDALIDNGDGVALGKVRALDPDATPAADGDEVIYYLVAPYTN